MRWQLSHRADPQANETAKRHYNCQTPNSNQFMPPGSCFVLKINTSAVWGTSYPIAAYVKHVWAGAWVNSLFRNESEYLSSELILEAIALTRGFYGEPPSLGMVTFVDPTKVKRKRDFGRCYRKAGFRRAICPNHMIKVADCMACRGMTKGGLIALQLLPVDMPSPLAVESEQGSLLAA